MDPEIKRHFPQLDDDNHKETSPSDFNYNCLAFALGDTNNWWEPPALFGHYWPPGFPQDITVETVLSIIRLHGFTEEMDAGVAPRGDAIAVYAEAGDWRHFAKFSGGLWFSKLGESKDISHSSLVVLEGPEYGKVVKIMARPSPVPE